jgi:subtilisin family serine protease
MIKKLMAPGLAIVLLAAGSLVPLALDAGLAGAAKGTIGINVLLNTKVSGAILAELGNYGKVRDVLLQVNALTMQARADRLPAIQALPYVATANPDAERTGSPVDTVDATDFMDGLSTWNLDAINVTNPGFANRQVAFDGTGVYVAVLDTGLVGTWRQYFPEERIAVEYAKCFGGGGGDMGTVSSQPKKWGLDVNSHGTHVTSTILGYAFGINPVNGVAPMANIIPVKVLNQTGSGWSSVIARGIEYVGDLKAGPLSGYPVVINMSLSGPVLDAVEQAAIDYAIEKGVIIVASAGNRGSAGMGYPGAYAPVISVAASGWTGEWYNSTWWYARNVADPTNAADFYIADFSSRELADQDLDIAAPGTWVVGPYQYQMGKTSYYFLGGTSMASPHVAGTVALMAQKNAALTASQAESILEGSAIYLAPGCLNVRQPSGAYLNICWGADATGAGLLDALAALLATP